MEARAFGPDDLWQIVVDYASFGNHHTGTPADVATTAWLVKLLDDLGASQIQTEPYDFDRYVVDAALIVGDEVVPTVPVFYSAVGSWSTTNLACIDASTLSVGSATGLDGVASQAPSAEALVLAIDGPANQPIWCNRVPGASFGRPAVVIPGGHFDRVAEHIAAESAELSFTASTEASSSANVLATFGSSASPRVSITTPLTGWTPAAGERGTGLAAALALAVDLSTDYFVEFSACSGHELDHIGLRAHLAKREVAGETAIHLGASVGAIDTTGDGPEQLAATRLCLTADRSMQEALATTVAKANFAMTDPKPPWPGEGGTWHEAGATVLSFLGGFGHFHAESDTPENATTPAAMHRAASVVVEATRIFLSRG